MKRKKFAIHIGFILYLVITLLPILIIVSSSFRSVGNSTSPLELFNEFSFESYRIAFTE